GEVSALHLHPRERGPAVAPPPSCAISAQRAKMARRGVTRSACCRAFAVGIARALSRQMAPRYSTTEDEDWCAWLRKLGESMRELRESLGLSQEELASRAGLSQGSVSRFENGRNSHIGALVILKLGAAL